MTGTKPSTEEKKTAIHEAGHAIVALDVGFGIEIVSIQSKTIRGHRSRGRTGYLYREPLSEGGRRLMARKEVLVGFAGNMAEALAGWEGRDADDFYRIDAIGKKHSFIKKCGREEDYGPMLRMRDASVAIVKRHWKAVVRLAKALIEHRTLKGSDVLRVLDGVLDAKVLRSALRRI